MNFDVYQQEARKTAQYPDIGDNIRYPLLGLIGETGELVEKIKKIYRGDFQSASDEPFHLENVIQDYILGYGDSEHNYSIEKELGDIAWYSVTLLSELKINASDVFFGKHQLLSEIQEKVIYETEKLDIYCISLGRLLGEIIQTVEHKDDNYLFLRESFYMFFTELCKIASVLEINMDDALNLNVVKLITRRRLNMIKGSGDNREVNSGSAINTIKFEEN